MPTISQVLEVVVGERQYQDRTWGEDAEHSIIDWATFMEEYLSRAKKAMVGKMYGPGSDEFALDCMRKAVALGVACMESHGAPARKPDDKFADLRVPA